MSTTKAACFKAIWREIVAAFGAEMASRVLRFQG
jgi:hypothetical protein